MCQLNMPFIDGLVVLFLCTAHQTEQCQNENMKKKSGWPIGIDSIDEIDEIKPCPKCIT